MDILEEKSVLGKTYGSKLRPDYVSPYHTDKKHIIGFTKKHGSKSKGMDGRKENATKKIRESNTGSEVSPQSSHYQPFNGQGETVKLHFWKSSSVRRE